MFDIKSHAGRLVEVRAGGNLDVEELKRFRTEFAALLAKTQGQLVIVVDWRETQGITDETGPLLIGVMRSDNPRLERAAHLTSRAIAPQLAQIAAASKNQQARRVFDSPVEL